jgi:hypothetical protein
MSDAVRLYGSKVVADGLSVNVSLVEAWVAGSAAIPDRMLLRLADLLAHLAHSPGKPP